MSSSLESIISSNTSVEVVLTMDIKEIKYLPDEIPIEII